MIDEVEGRGESVARVLGSLQGLDPAYAVRFLNQVESAEAHRQKMERQAGRLEWAGLASGLIVALAFLACSTWLIATGHEISGTIIATVDLVALVALFVSGSREQ